MSATGAYDAGQWNGTACTEAQLTLSNLGTGIHCLTRGQIVGLTFSAETGMVSMLAITVVLLIILRNYVRISRNPPPGYWRLISGPMDLYMLSLFCSDILQGLGGVLNVRWIHDGKLEDGSYCTAQGAIQQLGETSVAMTTTAIAVHTFVAVWWDKGSSALRVAIGVVTLIWLYVALFVGFGVGLHTHGSYETPTPYWCWVGSNYLPERLAGEYVWLWTTLFVSLLAYLPLFFWARGDISPDGERWWGVNFHGRGKGAMKAAISAEDGKKRLRALYMLAYPAVYCVVVLPLSVVRWITFDGTPVNSAANFVVVSIYNLSGFFNVLLFTLTRPNLLLMRPRAWYASRTGRPPAHNHNNHNHHPPGEELAMDERRRSEAIMPGDEEDEEVDDQGRPTGAGWNIPHSPASSVVSSFFANAATPRKGVVRELTLEAGEGEVLGGGEEYQLSPPTTGRRSNEGYGLSPPPTGRRSNDSRLRRPSNEGGRVSNDHRNPV